MVSLWLKFPDEVLFSHNFTEETRIILQQIFSNSESDSPWLQALSLLRFQRQATNKPMIKWYKNTPYFNWSLYTQLISGGGVHIVKESDGGFSQSFSYKMKHIWSLIAVQWNVARFLTRKSVIKNPLVESIALGMAMQSLIMRMNVDDDCLAKWLSMPEGAPSKHRKTVEQIQAIQMRRTEITDAWHQEFPSAVSEITNEDLPDYFWDDDVPNVTEKEPAILASPKDGIWKGKSVCAGNAVGLVILIDRNIDPQAIKDVRNSQKEPIILLFKNARPETTEFFEHADAIIYCNGGVLSHACTVAREVGIPCVTAVGNEFFHLIKNSDQDLFVLVDAHNGFVKLN